MCLDPVSMGVLSFAVKAIGAVASFAAQSAESAANARNAIEQNKIDQRQLTLRQIQENAAAAQKKQAQNVQEAEVKAEATVAQVSKGVTGLSVENLLNDVTRKAARNQTTISENARMAVVQIQEGKKAATVRAQSRIDSVPPPNPLSLIAGIGSAAITGYNTYQSYMA